MRYSLLVRCWSSFLVFDGALGRSLKGRSVCLSLGLVRKRRCGRNGSYGNGRRRCIGVRVIVIDGVLCW